MTNQIKIVTEIPQQDGSTIKQKFMVDFDPTKSSSINFEFVPVSDGGPILRPSKPPR